MINYEIKTKKDCTGCYACSNRCPQNCISMVFDREGFWYPDVEHLKCIKCSLCIKVCPIINPRKISSTPKAYASINNNEKVRLDSSSGGIFILIAEQVIDDGGVVFGAEFNEKYEVEHNFTHKKEELYRFRGSKYVQSKIGCTYKQVEHYLKQRMPVLFTGTPCQIAGLRSYLNHSYENLICIDFFCHGVPSVKIWNKYMSYRVNKAGAAIDRIDFRRKDSGWKKYSMYFLFKNCTEYRENSHKDLYMKAYLKNICLRPSCYNCSFKGINRQGDLTLADFWGIQNILPDLDDDKGTSLVILNNEVGQVVFEKIKKRMLYQEVSINNAIKNNPAAIKSSEYNSKRDDFMAEVDVLPFDQLVNKYCKEPLIKLIWKKLKFFIKKFRVKIVRDLS